MRSLKIIGIKISPGHDWEIHAEITRLIRRGGQSFVLSANVHGLNLARQNEWLAEFYNIADLVPVDGAGVVLAAKILGYNIPKRLTWADWGWSLARYLAKQGHSLYLLGAPQGIAEKAASQLINYAPGLKILGTHHGYFPKEGPANDAIIKKINQVAPDILIVCFGMPLQEKWIVKNHSHIKAKVFIVAGAAFEYLSGSLIRCPRWMGDLGLEWLFRLYLEPKRMARRYIWGNSIFLLNVLRERYGFAKF